MRKRILEQPTQLVKLGIPQTEIHRPAIQGLHLADPDDVGAEIRLAGDDDMVIDGDALGPEAATGVGVGVRGMVFERDGGRQRGVGGKGRA